jgi:YYY domain-containing protein
MDVTISATYQILYVAIWYLLVLSLGIILLPITTSVCSSLPDRGYSVSKILGILLIAYISWILSYAVGYSRYEIIVSLLLIYIFSFYAYIRLKPGIDWGSLFRNEIIFGSVFLFFLIIRAFNPEIHGGEKVNDFMLLNEIIKSISLPPYDSWLSGYRVNMYYYFGTYTIATLTKLTGIPANIAYNLGMALIPALAANAAFGIGYNLTQSKKAGIIAMFLLVFAGNLYSAGVIAAHMLGIANSPWGNVPDIVDYWGASRIIPHTINEFPYFSFIFGDLHAHVIAIPFVLLAITLILEFYFAKKISAIALVFMGLGIGTLAVSNLWDYPTYAALFVMVVMIKSMMQTRHVSGGINRIKDISGRLSDGILILVIGFLMFIAFFIDFKSSSIQGIKPVGERTALINFLAIYNLFLFLIFSFMLSNLPEFKHKKWVLAVLAVASAALYFYPNFQTLSVFVPLGFLSGINIYYFYNNNDKNRLFVSILIIMGLGILIFCELFYFKDLIDGSWGRMNTVFKYYIQVWLLWSTASAYAFFDLYKKKYRMRNLVLVMLSLLLVLNSLYLCTGTYAKAERFSSSPGLDGLAFMKKTNFGYYDAIFWVDMNINGTPVILEAPGESYQDTSLMSAYTGLPTVVGWAGHEIMWRNNWGELSQRIRDVDTIYDTADYRKAIALLKKYDVSYVYIGDVELKKYRETGLRKFENTSNFERVYVGAAEIYRVVW